MFWGFEFKFFSYRPAFLLECCLGLSGLMKQWKLYGTVSTPMVLYNVFNLIYFWDAGWFEEGLILMFDIIEEK